MIRFIIKGLLRDKSRSRLPVIVVSIGVMLTVWMHAYITGFMGDAIEMNARFSSGHMKVMTRAYAEDMELMPNDLALMDAGAQMDALRQSYPGTSWTARIQFGGLIDVPDQYGETMAQGPALGIGLDLYSPNTMEVERLNLDHALVQGVIPGSQGEVLISEVFSQKLGISPGQQITMLGTNMFGSMVMQNFIVSGTVSFGVEIMDRGTILMDIGDARQFMDMYDAAGEILGFLPGGFYDHEEAASMAEDFNKRHEADSGEFVPHMKTLAQQGSLGTYVLLADSWSWYISLVFIMAMSLVLWNAGLLGALRRYGEVGIRLAMGEEKGHIYRSMIYEAVAIGVAGTIIGTAAGLLLSWPVQAYGINIEGMMEGASMMLPTEIRSRITAVDYYIGFIPGLASMVLGTMLAGLGIYKRQTARLFKELEA